MFVPVSVKLPLIVIELIAPVLIPVEPIVILCPDKIVTFPVPVEFAPGYVDAATQEVPLKYSQEPDVVQRPLGLTER